MGEPEPQPPVVPSPWTDNTRAFFNVNEQIAAALTEEQKTALGTLTYDGSTFIRSNIALTNGETEADKIMTIPNLFQAVSSAYGIASTGDFGKNGIKTDRIEFSTADTGDIVIKVKDKDSTEKLYSLSKIAAAIETLNERTKNMYPNDEPIDITVTEEEPEPTPTP